MKFNHYETLVNLVLGYLLLIVLMLGLGIDYDNKFTVPYLAGAYVIGYMLNALSSFLEPIYYWTIGGMPSNQLLTVLTNKDYSGIKKVKFMIILNWVINNFDIFSIFIIFATIIKTSSR